MKPWHLLKPKTGKEIPFLILISFLASFAISRITAISFPDLFLKVKGIHVHHFTYGLGLLIFIGYFSLTQPRSPRTRLQLSILYGFALGLAFDEFAMWIQLEEVYQDRSTYDAVVLTSLVLLNIVYFEDFWRKWGHRLGRLLKRIFS